MILALCLLLAQDYEKLAPYTGVRWKDEAPEVEIDGAWVELLDINGTPIADIVAFTKETWPRIWQKRFQEDLVEVLSKMGKPPEATVSLKVRDEKGERVLDGVAMTKENRRKVWESGRKPRGLTREDAAADLDALKKLIDERYSYATLRGVKYAEAIETAKARAPESFALEVQRILALFKDGHTGVEGETLADGFLPFLVAEAEEGVVAFLEDRSAFVDPAHPCIKSIDGVAISKWLEAAEKVAPIRRARTLRHVRQMRIEMGLPAKDVVTVEFGKPREFPLSKEKPVYGTWPRTMSRVLDGNVGYFRLAQMDDAPVGLDDFKKTAGLVIDVRGNGGGTRTALRRLFPYFMTARDAPRVANVAKSRVGGDLSDRWLFPVDKFAGAELDAIRRMSFTPEWTPPAEQFGEWHYFILKPGGAPFHYDKAAVILMDGDSFSATDIFLGAFKGWRNVTLIGTRSGGGSGRKIDYELPRSRVRITLSSMASFQPDGKLYDGRGVEPDVVVKPKATDFIGTTDSVLDEALRRLRR